VLGGTCDTQDCEALAEQKVKALKGVKSIENRVNADRATDLTLRTSVQAIISKYEGVQADVAGGMVVLRGSIDRNQVQPLMNELQALQPRKLDNQLAIR
jgi:hyperosmotically inducible protein